MNFLSRRSTGYCSVQVPEAVKVHHQVPKPCGDDVLLYGVMKMMECSKSSSCAGAQEFFTEYQEFLISPPSASKRFRVLFSLRDSCSLEI